jgi:glyoxylase-like metal-dependent hydrolase (beta-lactamase superfamily II)
MDPAEVDAILLTHTDYDHTAGLKLFPHAAVDQYLFTGDNLSLHHGQVDHFNEFFNMNTAEQIYSLRKIARLPGIHYLITAHYGMTNHYHQAFRQWNRTHK